MPKATGQGGVGELAAAGGYLPGSPGILLPVQRAQPVCSRCYADAMQMLLRPCTCSLCQRRSKLGRLASPCQEVPGRAPHPIVMAHIQWLMWGCKDQPPCCKAGQNLRRYQGSGAPRGVRWSQGFLQKPQLCLASS